MIVYVLIALITDYGFSRSNSGVIQLEFNSEAKCLEAREIIKNKYDAITLQCVEIKK